MIRNFAVQKFIYFCNMSFVIFFGWSITSSSSSLVLNLHVNSVTSGSRGILYGTANGSTKWNGGCSELAEYYNILLSNMVTYKLLKYYPQKIIMYFNIRMVPQN